MTRRLDPERLRTLRRERDWSQWDLAREARVSVTTVRDAEAGRADSHIETLRKFAEVLGCAVPDLFTKEAREATTGP